MRRNKIHLQAKPVHGIFIFNICLLLCTFLVSVNAQELKTVRKGIEYAQVTKEIKGLNVNINLLRLDLKKVRLDVVHANDKAIGMETTSSIAARHNAIAAINGGFFRLDKSITAGEAAGVLMINGRLLSESLDNRSAVLIVNKRSRTEAAFDHIATETTASYGKGDAIKFDGINRERKPNEIVLYSPEMGNTTLTDASGTEIILDRCNAGKIIKCTVTDLRKNSGNTAIPAKGYVISIGGGVNVRSASIGSFLDPDPIDRKFRRQINLSLKLRSADTSRDLFAEDVTNGVSQLIKNGKIDITWENEKASRSFAETRHPRTAAAILKDGRFLMVTVDGRSESSGGISLNDLAEYLLSLGAVDAINLDGGGSTTMFLDGKVVNKPSDKEGERKVGDAIIVTLRKPERPRS